MEIRPASEHHAWLRGQALVRYYDQSESNTFGSTVYIRSRPPHAPAPQNATALTLNNLFNSASRTLPHVECAEFLDAVYSAHGALGFAGAYTAHTLYFQVRAGVNRNRPERIAHNIAILHKAMQRYTLLLAQTKYNPDSGESNHA